MRSPSAIRTNAPRVPEAIAGPAGSGTPPRGRLRATIARAGIALAAIAVVLTGPSGFAATAPVTASATPVTAAATTPVTGAAAAKPAITMSAVRSWKSPASTRIVFDFSAPVTPVMPDSGESKQLVVSIPGEPMTHGADVPGTLRVVDGVVDSVVILTDSSGARFVLLLHETTKFSCFTLRPEADKPFRLVVDVKRKGAEAAEEQKLASLAARRKTDRERLVVIDAGHGGEDTGARGISGIREKDVTLAVAKALAAELDQLPGVKTLLTRNGDWFIPLRERYRIAEKAKADVFISIHCNSSKRRGSGSGTEVYFLSLRGASDQADADLASLENAADLVGGVPTHAEDDLVNILYDVKRNSALQKSQVLAEALLDQISSDRIEARGVKQAGFVVLKSVEFPSVLVETAFINNPREARLLKDPAYQRTMAKQLSAGVKNYFQRTGVGLKVDGPPGEAQNAGQGSAGTN